ncbi:MAG TPA: prolyl oligopeptidase family serine peptidase [Candidatus Binataceae bacterium]|nr:prolyl oligopeptidase family serine peptidase [Candidatus Binataceae bacterium]
MPSRNARESPSKRMPGAREWLIGLAALALATLAMACRKQPVMPPNASWPQIKPFNFQITESSNDYQIEGYIASGEEPGRLPAMLVLNGEKGKARQCIKSVADFATMGIRVVCVSLPGYGRSSGPGRFVGAQSVATARHAIDLLAARPEVDPKRIAVWGMGDGAVAAGLLMDSDRRPRAFILQSGAYDMLKLWPEAPLRTKLDILRQVWPSKRALRERSVVEHLPGKLDCSILILHGESDRRMPVKQAEQLAAALSKRGAHIQTYYVPQGSHDLGARAVAGPVRGFLRNNLMAGDQPPLAAATQGPG